MTDNPTFVLCPEAQKIASGAGDLIVKDGHLTDLFFHIFDCVVCVHPAQFGTTVLTLTVKGHQNISLGIAEVGAGGQAEDDGASSE